MLKIIFGTGILAAALILVSAAVPDNTKYLSPSAVICDKAGKKLYIAEKTANQVAIFDTVACEVTSTISLPGSPGSLALSSDGNSLYITLSEPNGKLCKIRTINNKIQDVFNIGHTPSAITLSPDGNQVYVTNRFDNTVSIFNTETHAVENIKVAREPFDLAITQDSQKLIVTHLLPNDSAPSKNYISAQVSIIDTAAKTVTNINLPNGSVLAHGVTISPDNKYAYVTHLLGHYDLPANQIERGWIVTNALSIIDMQNNTLFNTVLLDDLDLGAANPWDIICSPDGNSLYITHAGTDEISVINRTALHRQLTVATNAVCDLGMMAKVGRQRIATKVKGPRCAALANGKIWVTGYFSKSIASIAPNAKKIDQLKLYSLGDEPVVTDARRGEMLFNDATICFQQWLSCTSCHPDGRADGLNWDQLNDGFGNPKQTKSLLYSHETPPTTITGCRPNAEASVRGGLAYNYFQIRPENEAAAIDEYLLSLHAVSSPYTVNGQFSKSAIRGKAIFEGVANCSNCHSGKYFTNMKAYNVGSGTGTDANTKFDTPSLREIWRIAPYLYDGRAVTIKEVLTKYNQNDLHGNTSELSESEISDLVEYILSL
ncbi:MAG: hypothetical protein A2Y07_04390 [Planctomycetes bacterium GWF2_50_10]|nr:MAG: hypothetical protein A2Y07_04390 [Planctomycetes bacterium GWF2_50_10]